MSRFGGGTAVWLGLGAGALLVLTWSGMTRADEAGDEELPMVELVERPAFPLPAHLESADIAAGKYTFDEIFDAGGKLFGTAYNGLDGVGIKLLPNGVKVNRFTLEPFGASILATSAQSCGGCHNMPVPSSAGLSQTNVINDTGLDGKGPFNQRSTTSVFGDGLLQRLSEEITEELQATRAAAAEEALGSPGTAVTRPLSAKGVDYGEIVATADAEGEVSFDLSGLQGIDPDLVVRPLSWKGSVPTVRTLVTAASSLGLGMQTEDFVWRNPGGDENPDLDADGVVRELSVGDVTAMTVYTAGQETPQELGRLAERGWVQAPTPEQAAQIERGRAAFGSIGCGGCHLPEMPLEDTVFEEPTARGNGNYVDRFLLSRDPDYDPARPLRFDLASEAQEPRVERREGGGATVRLYGDLKRHAMGRWMAEPGGPSNVLTPQLGPLMMDGEMVLVPADVFLTAELWGVGNTGPWLHDARAGTLREAIELHGEDEPVAVGEPGRSEAQEARDAFLALPEERRADVVAFLLNLRTFSPPED